jgi:hypothetical protein
MFCGSLEQPPGAPVIAAGELMHKRSSGRIILFIFIGLTILSCGPVQALVPTLAPTDPPTPAATATPPATSTVAPTSTPIPSQTPTVPPNPLTDKIEAVLVRHENGFVRNPAGDAGCKTLCHSYVNTVLDLGADVGIETGTLDLVIYQDSGIDSLKSGAVISTVLHQLYPQGLSDTVRAGLNLAYYDNVLHTGDVAHYHYIVVNGSYTSSATSTTRYAIVIGISPLP